MMSAAQIENDRIMVAIAATPEEEFERVYQEYRAGKGIDDPVTRLATKIADRVNIWESKYGEGQQQHSSATRDEQYYDNNSVLVTGDDALPGLSPAARARFRREDRERAIHKERAKKANEMGYRVREPDYKPSEADEDTTRLHPTSVGDAVKTLADVNKAHAAKFRFAYTTRDHSPVVTLASINARNRELYRRPA
jgi:hypothetical protein